MKLLSEVINFSVRDYLVFGYGQDQVSQYRTEKGNWKFRLT